MIFFTPGMVSEARKEAIRKEARQILDGFAKTLGKVSAPKNYARISGFGREEKAGLLGDEDFRRRMFANAPKKNEDCIIAEKGAWI